MPCSQTLAGIPKDCASNMGGIVLAMLANKADVASVTLTDNKVSAITMATGAKFYKYNFKPNTSNLASTYQVNNENGTTYVQSLLQLVFNRMETSKRVEVSALAQGELVAIVKDANGLYWFLGYDAPLFLNAGDGQTGTARADRNGYSITLEDDSREMPYEVNVGSGSGQVNLEDIVAE